jgi:hypothetical protein
MKSFPGALFVLVAGGLSSLAADANSPASTIDATASRLATLFLIGDSAVKNGRGDGAGGLWGWGQVIAEHFVQGLRGLVDCPLSRFLIAKEEPGGPMPRATGFRFDFGSGRLASGFAPVRPTTIYSREIGCGFDLGSKVEAVDRGGDDPLRSDFVSPVEGTGTVRSALGRQAELWSSAVIVHV